MVKRKVAHKKKTVKKTSGKTQKKTTSTPQVKIVKQEVHEVEKILVENFTSLQKVLTNLAIKIDQSTEKMSNLLTLFEDSAKTLAENDFQITGNNPEGDKRIMQKLDHLEDQNKLIARGLTLIHDSTNRPREQPTGNAPQGNYSSTPSSLKKTTEELP